MRPQAFICTLTITAFTACGRANGPSSSPEEQIVRKLGHTRVVMLADFAHEYPLPYRSAISTLSTWLTMVEKGESDQFHLTLFLEEDDETAGLIRSYLST